MRPVWLAATASCVAGATRRSRRRRDRVVAEHRSSGPERRRARRVARDDEQLRAGCQQVLGDLDRELLELGRRCARRTGTARCRRGRDSPRAAATRATRAGRSARRRRSRTRRSAVGGRGPCARMVPDARAADPRRDFGDPSWPSAEAARIARAPMRALIVTNMYPSRGAAGARQLRPRPGRGAAADRRRRRRAVRVRAGRRRRVRARRARPAPAPRRPVRRRPRPLRPDRVAGVRARGPAPRGDAPRHRPGPPALAQAHARGAAVHRPRRGGLGAARDTLPAWAAPAAAVLPPASTSSASARSRAPRRGRTRARPGRPVPAVPGRPARPEKRYDRARGGRRRTRFRLLTLGQRRPGAGPAVRQRRQRRARPVRARGLRARRARGAGVRRAGARDAGRYRTRGPRRYRRDLLRAVRRGRVARPRWRRTSPTATREIDGRARAERYSTDGWRHAWWRRWRVAPTMSAMNAAPATRSRLRRRARYLRRRRELQLRDIGGFVGRAASPRPRAATSWSRRRSRRALETDRELRGARARRLTSGRSPAELREPGIGGACPDCGTVHGSDDRYCSWCGRKLSSRTASRRRRAARQCAACGATLEPDQEWCVECGTARTVLHRPPDWRGAGRRDRRRRRARGDRGAGRAGRAHALSAANLDGLATPAPPASRPPTAERPERVAALEHAADRRRRAPRHAARIERVIAA